MNFVDIMEQKCVCGHTLREHSQDSERICLAPGDFPDSRYPGLDSCIEFVPVVTGPDYDKWWDEECFASGVLRRNCSLCRESNAHGLVPSRMEVIPKPERQPLPTEGDTPVILEAIKYLSDRALMGKKKYGRLLETNNGRDAYQDALEEAADLFMYLFQKRLENEGK
jgi:hypothetical protein